MTTDASPIAGDLYSTSQGEGPPMVLVQPNAVDHTSWLYQVAHFSQWFTVITMDLPGYGKSPTAGPGLTMQHLAEACWAAARKELEQRGEDPEAPAVIGGVSIGSMLVMHMAYLRPESTSAIVFSGGGFIAPEERAFTQRRITGFRRYGLDYLPAYTLECFAPRFRASELGRYFADLFHARNSRADVDTIVRMYEAMAAPEPEDLYEAVTAPTLILTGTEDEAYTLAHHLVDHLSDVRLERILGAGHSCYVERPGEFNSKAERFLRDLELLPDGAENASRGRQHAPHGV